MEFKGNVFKYGDDINTDVIFPGRYLNVFDADEMAKYAMADLDAEFVKKVKKGDIVVAGKYFGCGSSREQAATCLKAAGVSTIIAKSFARIFYRNAINQGLAIMICPNIDEIVSTGDELEITPETGEIKNLTNGKTAIAKKLPPFILGILSDGGLIAHVKKSIASK